MAHLAAIGSTPFCVSSTMVFDLMSSIDCILYRTGITITEIRIVNDAIRIVASIIFELMLILLLPPLKNIHYVETASPSSPSSAATGVIYPHRRSIAVHNVEPAAKNRFPWDEQQSEKF